MNFRHLGFRNGIMMEATCMNARKFRAFFSYPAAPRWYCLSFDLNRSTKLRALCRAQSVSRGAFALKTLAQTPVLASRSKRRQAEFQSPKRSEVSRLHPLCLLG